QEAAAERQPREPAERDVLLDHVARERAEQRDRAGTLRVDREERVEGAGLAGEPVGHDPVLRALAGDREWAEETILGDLAGALGELLLDVGRERRRAGVRDDVAAREEGDVRVAGGGLVRALVAADRRDAARQLARERLVDLAADDQNADVGLDA